MRRNLVFLGCLSICLFLVKEIALAEAIRVGIPGLSAEFTPVWAAKDKGLLKKYGLDVEIIAMQGGTQLVQAMIGNSIDFSVMGGGLSHRRDERRRSGHGRHPHGQVSLFVDRQAVDQAR